MSKFLAALVILFTCVAAWGFGRGGGDVGEFPVINPPTSTTNYYVNASTGSDSNNGLTTGTAWQTLHKVNNTSFAPGAIVNLTGSFSGGDNGLVITTSVTGGNFGITSYGAGATISSGNSTACVSVTNVPSVTVSNITCTGGGNGSNTTAGISFVNSQSGNTKLAGPVISNVTVSGYGDDGIVVNGTNGSSGFIGISISNVTVHDVTGNSTNADGTAAVFILSEGSYGSGTTTPAHTNITLTNIIAYNLTGVSTSHWEGSGIVVGESSNVSASGLLVHDFGANSSGGDPCGVWSFDSTLVHFFQFEVYHGGETGANAACGVDLDGGVTNSIAEQFWSHDNNGPGAILYAFNDGTVTVASSNNVLRDFIVQNDQRNGVSGAGEVYIGARSGGTVTNPQAYNFTCYAGTAGVCIGQASTGTVNGSTALVANAVLYGVSGDNLVNVAHPGTLQLQGNDYYGSTDFSWSGTGYTTYASFVSGASVESVNGGHTFNPQIYVPGGGFITAGYVPAQMMAYNPQTGSPVINAGINLQTQFSINPGTQDFFGNTVTSSTLPIGAGAADFATFTASCTQASTFLALTSSFAKFDNVNYNSWICGTNSDGDLALMDVAYLLAAPNHAAMLLDVSGNSHTLTEHGTVTFTGRTGIASDGTTGYEDTGWNVSSGPNYTQNSVTTGGYDMSSPGTISGSATLVGVSNHASTAETTIIPQASAGGPYIDANDETGASPSASITSALGFWTGQRTSSTALAIYQNGVLEKSATVSSVALPSQDMFILAESGNGADSTPPYSPLANSYFTDTVSLAFAGGGGISPLNTSLRANSFVQAYYQGPGDAVPGAIGWWGLRCYSGNYSGNVADIWDAATGNTTETLLTCSKNGIVNQTVNSLSVTCAVACRVKTLYDQSGNGVDTTQATNANRPTFTTNGIGGRWTMSFSGAASQGLASSADVSPTSQPFTVSTVAERTVFASANGDIISNGNTDVQILFSFAGGYISIFLGSSANGAAAADNSPHSAQAVANTTSTIDIDGTTTSLGTGLGSGTWNTVVIGSAGQYPLTGMISEVGIWTGALSTVQQGTMHVNQSAFYGTP